MSCVCAGSLHGWVHVCNLEPQQVEEKYHKKKNFGLCVKTYLAAEVMSFADLLKKLQSYKVCQDLFEGDIFDIDIM